ncbi:MAG TPA: cupin domain-containing protein [Planctomycetota bacterium]|nr:cupin domain-containing protein [Planctomycetota bacterium]
MPFLDTPGLRRFDAAALHKTNLFQTEHLFCDLYGLEPGQSQKLHSHADATKFYFVLEGRPRITIAGETRDLSPGGLAFAAPGEPHGVDNPGSGRAVLLVAMAPNPNRPVPGGS